MKKKVNRIEGGTLYEKLSNGRYRAVGLDLQHSTLNEGLWLVRKNGSSMISVAHLVDKLRDYELTIDDITTIEEYKDKIVIGVLDKFYDKKEYSVNDMMDVVLAELITVIKKENL